MALSNYPKFQAFNPSTGGFLSGGLLYTYEAGTATEPKTTYQDKDYLVPNTNPIVLDANGEATIYTSGSYKLVLKTSAGVTLWTLDNYLAANGLIGDLVPEADKFPYFPTTLTAALTAITALGRSLLARASAQLMRNDLDAPSRALSEITATASGTDTYTANLDPAITAYTSGAYYFITFTNANTAVAPTLNLNSLGAKTIKLEGGGALVAGNIIAGHHAILKYDGTDMLLLNHWLVPDNSTLERSTGSIRIKDLGVVEAKIDALAVTEGKIGALAVTSGKIGSGAVTQGKLATSTGSVSTTSMGGVNLTLPGGEYGFYPQIKASTEESQIIARIADVLTPETTYYTNIFLANPTGHTSYAQQRYITSSGEIFWLFILRDKLTGDILSMWQAPDHPCFGNGGKPNLIQHPFADVRENRWLGNEEVEIIIVNPAHDLVQEAMFRRIAIEGGYPDKNLYQNYMSKAKKKSGIWLGALRTWEARDIILADSDEEAMEFLMDYQGFIIDENRPNRDLLAVFQDEYELDKQTPWEEKVCTVALPDEDLHGSPVVDWRMTPAGTPIDPIKTQILQPQDSKLFTLKEK